MKVRFPEEAVPGAILDSVPPGLGGEDFGGSVCGAKDGKLYLQAGKTGFWNVEVVGLESVRKLEGGALTVSESDVHRAAQFKGQYAQETAGTKSLSCRKKTPAFTGEFGQGLCRSGNRRIHEAGRLRRAMRGQLGRCAALPRLASRGCDAVGEWGGGPRISLRPRGHGRLPARDRPEGGSEAGGTGGGGPAALDRSAERQATAVLYRPKSDEKAPKVFYSGIVGMGTPSRTSLCLPMLRSRSRSMLWEEVRR